ncbi:hypothetical protein [Agromyces neolithicus]|uniref:Zf-HC2 domain-containing protein n=1 Tax=Agromyces neolithicus TaxID=269420 RepID=A0ABN2M891_9MICO
MTEDTVLSRETIARLTLNTEPWLSCDACFEQVDVALEALFGSSVPPVAELRAHLRGCATCHEEAQSLAALVADQYDMAASVAVARLDIAITTAGA